MTFEHLYLALRSLRHRPAFIATVVLTLAVGIGATTAAFALLDSVLLTRLPVSDQDRLVGLWAVNPEYPSQQWDVPWDTHTLRPTADRYFSTWPRRDRSRPGPENGPRSREPHLDRLRGLDATGPSHR